VLVKVFFGSSVDVSKRHTDIHIQGYTREVKILLFNDMQRNHVLRKLAN